MSEQPVILVVDDEPELRDAVALALETEDYIVLTAASGDDALSVLENAAVDLVIADIAMPGMNGYQLFTHIAEHPQWGVLPVIFLSGRDLDSDVRFGKELGVDDYLTKPVAYADLLASVRGKLKRARRRATNGSGGGYSAESTPSYAGIADPPLRFGALKIDTAGHRVWLSGGSVQLSAREYKLLHHLARDPEHVASPQELIRVTHDIDTDAIDASNLVRPLIRSLRRKLGYAGGERGCIENVRGVGYRLLPPQ